MKKFTHQAIEPLWLILLFAAFMALQRLEHFKQSSIDWLRSHPFVQAVFLDPKGWRSSIIMLLCFSGSVWGLYVLFPLIHVILWFVTLMYMTPALLLSLLFSLFMLPEGFRKWVRRAL